MGVLPSDSSCREMFRGLTLSIVFLVVIDLSHIIEILHFFQLHLLVVL